MALGSVGSMAVALLGDIKDFNSKMDSATGKVSTFDKTVGKMGASVTKAAKAAAVAAAAAVTAYGVSAVKTFADFDTSMRQVFTLMPDLSAEAKDVMIEDVMELSDAIDILPSEIIPALYQAISAGVPRENVFTYLEVAGEAAVGGAVELEGMVVALAQVMNAYGAEVDSARSYSDMFFSIIADGLTTMEELSSELFKVAPVAADVGIAFSGIAGWMAELTSQGVPAAEAASYMKVALNELSKAGTLASDTFEKAAGVTFPDFIAAGGDIVDAFGIIDQYAIDTDISVKDMFGSIEAGGAVLMATGRHFDSFSEKVGNAEDAAGKTTDAYTEMAAGIQRELDGLAAWWERLQIDIGGDLTENLQDLLGWLEENREAIGDGIKAVFDGLIDGLEWMQANSGIVKAALITMAVGFTALWTAANPVAAAIMAVVAALSWFESSGGVSNAYDNIQDLAQGFRDLVVGEKETVKVTQAVTDALVTALVEAGSAMQDYLDVSGLSTDKIGEIWAQIVQYQQDALESLAEGERFDKVLDRFSKMSTGLLDEYGILDDEIMGILGGILSESAKMWSEATGVVIGSAEDQAEGITESVRVISDAFTEEQRVLRETADAAWESSKTIAEALESERDAMGQTAETARTVVKVIAEALEDEREAVVDTTSEWYIHAGDVIKANTAKLTAINEANAEIQASYEQMWESVKTNAATALVDMVNSFVDYGDTREQEEKDHQQRIQDIKDQYAEDSQTALDTALGIEESEYKAHRTTVAGVLRDMAGDFFTFLADQLLALAAAESVKSAAAFLSLNPVQGTASALAAGRYLVGWGAMSVMSSSIPGYADGGIIPGLAGEPQIIMAHGEERVLNQEQQDDLAIDYERMGNAVAAGVYDAMSEIGSDRPINIYLPDGTALARALFPGIQAEEARRGGVA